MREETDLKVDIDRARKAESFINNPLFIKGLAILKASTLDKFELLTFEQTAEMQDCNRMLKVIDEFETIYINIIHTGNAALNALTDLKDHQEAMNNER